LLLELVRLEEAQVTFGGSGQSNPDNLDFSLYLNQAMTASPQPGSVTSSGVQVPAGSQAGPAVPGDLVNRVAADNGLSPNLLRAVVAAESGGNPAATSSAGAMGLMQLMPDTAASLGVVNAYDPVQNLYGGAKYLKGLISRYGDVRLALAAYNSGPGTLSRLGVTDWGRDQGKLPAETQAYVPKVLGLYGSYA